MGLWFRAIAVATKWVIPPFPIKHHKIENGGNLESKENTRKKTDPTVGYGKDPLQKPL